MSHQQLSFKERVWLIVSAIPERNVASYGDIARMAGSPRAVRQVGCILKHLPGNTTLPWHRVINAQGSVSLTGTDWVRQKEKLEAEGIEVSSAGKISLQHYRWAG